MAHEIPISSLNASSARAGHEIRGVVRLIWPFSQSAQTFALLLSDLDFKAQIQHGQIRIRFSGSAARVVAEGGVGIGDVLQIQLEGSRWIEGVQVRTPGKGVDGELSFHNKLNIQVVSGDGHIRNIHIDEKEEDAAPAAVAVTPARQIYTSLHNSESIPSRHISVDRSPAFSKASERSSPFSDAFVEELLDDEGPRKRSRISLGQVRDWRYAKSTSSAGDEDDGDAAEPSDQAKDAAIDDRTAQEVPEPSQVSLMLPPPLPPLQLPSHTTSSNSAPLTPTLQPVSTASLPLPSPFPDESMQINFPATPTSKKQSTEHPIDGNSITVQISTRSLGVETEQPTATTNTSRHTRPPSTPTRVIDKTVYTSLFGTLPDQVSDQSSTDNNILSQQHQKSDFEIAETQFAESLLDSQESISDPTSHILSPRQASAEEDDDGLDRTEKEEAEKPWQTHTEISEMESSVPPAMSKWSKARVLGKSVAVSVGDEARDVPNAMRKWSNSRKSVQETPITAKRRELQVETKVIDEFPVQQTTTKQNIDTVTEEMRDVPDVMCKWSNPRKNFPNATVAPLQRAEPAIRLPERVQVKSMDNTPDQRPQRIAKPATVLEPISQQALRGLQTEHAYFARLGHLGSYLNTVNEQGTSAKRIDVMVVVAEGVKPAKKLEAGRRDWYNTMQVIDQSTHDLVKIDVFRPYHASLPKAELGDVLLLRAFGVQSFDRQAYLKSNDESAWCVWRFAKSATDAQQYDAVEEEVRGPPVEYGDDERIEAVRLHQWFMAKRARQLDAELA